MTTDGYSTRLIPPMRIKYQGHGQWNGTFKWTCFDCGNCNATQFRPGTYKMQCKACSHWFIRSDRVARLPHGRVLPPPDSIIPIAAEPNAPLPLVMALPPLDWFEWSSGMPANSYDDAELDGADEPELATHS